MQHICAMRAACARDERWHLWCSNLAAENVLPFALITSTVPISSCPRVLMHGDVSEIIPLIFYSKCNFMFAKCDDFARDNRKFVACAAAEITYYYYHSSSCPCSLPSICSIDGSGHVSIHVRHTEWASSSIRVPADKKWSAQHVTVWQPSAVNRILFFPAWAWRKHFDESNISLSS